MARPTSLEAISLEPSPDIACTGLPIALAQSLDQRSPQRLSVAFEPSTTLSISAIICVRGVIVRSRDGDALLADRLDLLRPRIDQGHVVSRTREEPAEIAADRARADEENLHGAHSPCEDAECTTPQITSGRRRPRARERCAAV